MDPNEILRRLRELCALDNCDLFAMDEIADLFEALDGWITKGGFLPTEWERADQAEKAAKAIGVSTTYAYRNGRVEVPAEQLLAMVHQLSQAGWKYEGASE